MTEEELEQINKLTDQVNRLKREISLIEKYGGSTFKLSTPIPDLIFDPIVSSLSGDDVLGILRPKLEKAKEERNNLLASYIKKGS